MLFLFCFFKQKTAYEMRISDWSSDVCSSDRFVQVEVTGRSGDGGIDGTGILRLSLMSFHVLFQCKRYQGSVGSGAVRDFRGAMMGRTDKGLKIGRASCRERVCQYV